MTQDEIVAFLNAADDRTVLICRFTDGTEVEIADPLVRTSDGKSECIATVVRQADGIEVMAGQSLCVALDQVAEVKRLPRQWEYCR